MDRGLDIHQMDELVGEITDVLARAVQHLAAFAMCFIGVDEQLHLQRLHVSVHELDDRRAEARVRRFARS